MPSTKKMRCWELSFPRGAKFLRQLFFFFILALFCINTDACRTNSSGKPPTTRPKLTMRASLGRGRGIRFFPATAPDTPVVPGRGTLRADNLRLIGPSDGPKLSDRLAEKRLLGEPSSPTDKAEAPAKDALVGRRSSSRQLRVTYADKDPRDIMKALRQGNRNYIDKFEELLDGMEAQMEVCNHSPSPKHLADKKFLGNF